MMSNEDRYSQCIQRALALMERSLANEQAPSLSELANAACLSPFHFHRIYRLITGETCQQTLSRLKLAKATVGIQANRENITHIAMSAGFGSGQALAKALKRDLQVTASELRKEPERLADAIAYLSKPHNYQRTQAPISVELVNLAPMSVVAIRTSNQYPALNATYEKLFIQSGGPENVKAILGLPGDLCSRLGDEDNQFDCALLLNSPMQELPPSLTALNVEAGSFIRVRHQGSYAELDNTIDSLYLTMLGQEQVNFAHRSCLFHYLDDPEQVEETFLRTDIYLPIMAG